MANRTDRLFAEVDRQLTEIRAYADGIATRAGLLISATALASSILGPRLVTLKHGSAAGALIALGISAALGILVLTPALSTGPTVTSLGTWAGGTSSTTINEIYAAKLLALEANLRRLLVMRVVFYTQVIGVAVAITLALITAGR